MAKGKQCWYLGNILEQTPGKDSFIVLLNSGDKIRRHKRFIRLENGEKDENDETAEECKENAEDDSTMRANADRQEEQGRMRTRSTHGRIDPFHMNKDQNEVP